jgi:hypothetical protein
MFLDRCRDTAIAAAGVVRAFGALIAPMTDVFL